MTPPRTASGQSSVKPRLTATRRKRPKKDREAADIAAMLRRMMAALARRVGDGNIPDLALFAELAKQLDTATGDAVDGLREQGHSWADIGEALGTTRQAAFQRWAKR